MGGGHVPIDPPDKEGERRPSLLPSVEGVRLADAPILILVYFHTAIRAEIAELRRVAVSAAADEKSESHLREFVLELSRRFEFFKLVYKYHCAAEDEVSYDLAFLFCLVAEKMEERKRKIPMALPFQIKVNIYIYIYSFVLLKENL